MVLVAPSILARARRRRRRLHHPAARGRDRRRVARAWSPHSRSRAATTARATRSHDFVEHYGTSVPADRPRRHTGRRDRDSSAIVPLVYVPLRGDLARHVLQVRARGARPRARRQGERLDGRAVGDRRRDRRAARRGARVPRPAAALDVGRVGRRPGSRHHVDLVRADAPDAGRVAGSRRRRCAVRRRARPHRSHRAGRSSPTPPSTPPD